MPEPEQDAGHRETQGNHEDENQAENEDEVGGQDKNDAVNKDSQDGDGSLMNGIRWTEQEDLLLLQLCTQGIEWKDITGIHIPRHSKSACS